ncbi:hypothetical protein H9Q10_09710 [Eikenella sp. S3360]|uniref:Lipoprotein n=1 Tax=Eikenella glucosivorans TaxID=2766967 RepID=A0ABS0NCA2_9NEIS|nr:hypothetical protein [Eikenella glucosivorans]MBH5329940.1 hypothetical protein [Eikenella glucosivorans]
MSKLILSVLPILLTAACNNGATSHAAGSNTQSTQPSTQHSSSPIGGKTTDWTPLFQYLETKGCGHASPELNTLLKSLYDWKIDDHGTADFGDDRVDIHSLKTPIPPKGFEHVVGQKISYFIKGDTHTLSLPIQGTYHGIPVKALERYGLESSAVSGAYLILDMPLSEAQAKLHNVRYAIPTFQDEEEGMGLFEPKDFQASLETNNNGETALFCVYF